MNEHTLATTKELALLFDLNPEPMFVVDVETMRFLAVNDTMVRKYGYSRDEFLRMSVAEIRPTDERDRFQARFYEDDANDNTIKTEWRHQAKDGTVFEVEISLSPLVFHDRPARLVLAHDITDRRNAEREHLQVQRLEIALEKERELKAHKERFVSALAHEFRTPLAMIRAAADMIQRYHSRMTAERIHEKMTQIMEQVADMQRMMEDMLALHRGEAIGVRVHPQAMDLLALCQQVMGNVRVYDQSHHPILLETIGINGSTLLDAQIVEHILGNLLINAVKYSDHGKPVELHIEQQPEAIVFTVRDHGIGIPEADQPHLFAPFKRASNVGERQGTGLGLAIVKQNVEAHGGSITFDSVEGEGTTFVVSLPMMNIPL